MRYKYITSIAVMTIVLLISIMSIITEDKEISDLEGRELQTLPTPSKIINESFNKNAYIYELLTGSMFEKWDNYFSDQIYNRSSIIDIFTYLQEKLDKRYINGVFLGKDDYLFSHKVFNDISSENLIDSANHFNKIAEKFLESKTYIVNLPTKDMVYEDKLPIKGYRAPGNFYISEMLKNINKKNINILDFREVIDNNEELYYKTDHHWNMEGAYKAYNFIINNINKDFKDIGKAKLKSDFEIISYNNYFIGSDGRKICQLVENAEDIQIYYNKEYDTYNIYNQDGVFKLIHDEQLDINKYNDDYRVYLNGNNAEVKIENLNASNDLKIVMIGDSMDNPLIPLMSSHFKNIYSYDLRFYMFDIVKTIEEINPDIIMYIGLSDNFIYGENSEIFKWSLD